MQKVPGIVLATVAAGNIVDATLDPLSQLAAEAEGGSRTEQRQGAGNGSRRRCVEGGLCPCPAISGGERRSGRVARGVKRGARGCEGNDAAPRREPCEQRPENTGLAW